MWPVKHLVSISQQPKGLLDAIVAMAFQIARNDDRQRVCLEQLGASRVDRHAIVANKVRHCSAVVNLLSLLVG